MARQLFRSPYFQGGSVGLYFLFAWVFFALFDDIALTGFLLLALIFVLSIPETKSVRIPSYHFARRLLTLVGLMVVGVGGFNYIVNPYGMFEHRWIEPIALNSQKEKTELYEAAPVAPDVLVFGSSRSFTVPPAYIEELTGLRSFNASMQAGQPQEYLAFARHIDAQGNFPQLIIIGLGVEQVTESSNRSWLDGLLQNVMTARQRERLLGRWERVRQLFTVQTTDASFRALRTDREREVQLYTFDADGLGHFHTTNPLDSEVNTMVQGSWKGYFDLNSVLDPLRLEDLHDLLELCRAHDTMVIIYLPPYHSRLLASFVTQPYERLKLQLLQELTTWQDEESFQVYDFTDPVSFGGNDQLFIDAIHPSEAAARLMLAIMLRDFES